MATMRRRSPTAASIEIIRISTHIEHGLKPSRSPIATVKRGSPTSSRLTRLPIHGRSMTPASGTGCPGGRGDERADLRAARRLVDEADEEVARWHGRQARAAPAPGVPPPAPASLSRAGGSRHTSRIVTASRGCCARSFSRKTLASAQWGQPSRTNTSSSTAAAGSCPAVAARAVAAGHEASTATSTASPRAAAQRARRRQREGAGGRAERWVIAARERRAILRGAMNIVNLSIAEVLTSLKTSERGLAWRGSRPAPRGVRPQPHRGGPRQAALAALPARVHALLRLHPVGRRGAGRVRRVAQPGRGHGKPRHRDPRGHPHQRGLLVLAGISRGARHRGPEAPASAGGEGPARRATAGAARGDARPRRRRRVRGRATSARIAGSSRPRACA